MACAHFRKTFGPGIFFFGLSSRHFFFLVCVRCRREIHFSGFVRRGAMAIAYFLFRWRCSGVGKKKVRVCSIGAVTRSQKKKKECEAWDAVGARE
jgi:hypothetical protein